jgi:hypothetical protein
MRSDPTDSPILPPRPAGTGRKSRRTFFRKTPGRCSRSCRPPNGRGGPPAVPRVGEEHAGIPRSHSGVWSLRSVSQSSGSLARLPSRMAM